MLADEILSEDPVLGQRVLDGMISWGGLDVKTYPDTFSSLTDYMVYRVEDVGAEYVLYFHHFLARANSQSQSYLPHSGVCVRASTAAEGDGRSQRLAFSVRKTHPPHQ